ncbi:hypothetical protein [Cellulomonas septica]|uniref:Ig-like domain-containing protein n=1 Tax=Cellulomonas septica TaxID=285080 RepID=A0ABX1JYH5_9CELL|nr:hypothetical protein [Cellulomonas septica]NKY39386.1 hypothetical protein [Cellulomonas septica]
MTSQRTIRTLVIVDAVLVVAFLVLLVVTLATRSGGDGETASTASPTTSASASSAPADEFRLPSGNIACAMSGDGVTCTIASYTYAPPEVPGCTGDTGHVLTLGADGVAFACEEGPAPTVAGSDVRTLEYGSETRVDGYTCKSGTDGVTCTDADGVGFRLARASWTPLP